MNQNNTIESEKYKLFKEYNKKFKELVDDYKICEHFASPQYLEELKKQIQENLELQGQIVIEIHPSICPIKNQ